jgi:hypothetical protein
LLFSTEHPAARPHVAHAAVADSQLGNDPRYLAIDHTELLELRALGELLDNDYFELHNQFEQGQVSEDKVIAAFSKARAANSLMFLADGEPSEAIYEALSAVSEPTGLAMLAEQSLRAST